MTTPQDAQQAWRHADRWEKAQGLELEGYRFQEGLTPCIYVYRPGSKHVDYLVGTGSERWSCTCPDFVKHGDLCKHTLAAELWACEQAEIARLEDMQEWETGFTAWVERGYQP